LKQPITLGPKAMIGQTWLH